MNKWVLLFLLFDDVYGIAVILQHFPYSLKYTSAVKDLSLAVVWRDRVVKEASKQTVVVSCFAAPESLTSAAR